MSGRDVCKYCGTRLIFPIDVKGRKMPPVDAGPDPAGTVGIVHEATGTWRGRWLAATDTLAPAEHRHAQHHCEGLERQHQRGRWTAAQSAHAKGQRRRRAGPRQQQIIPGIRIDPGRQP